jgi:hypothetical protein
MATQKTGGHPGEVKWGNIAQWVSAGVALSTLLGINRYLESGKVIEWISTIVTGVVIGVIAGLILMAIKRLLGKNSHTNNAKWIATRPAVTVIVATVAVTLLLLPSITTRISEFVKKESYIIAQETRKDIFKDAREDHEKGITTLVDSEAVRKVVYRDALDQAAKKGYIFFLIKEGRHVTAYDHRDQNRLLTEKQRNAVEDCFFTEPPLEEKDSYSSMCRVLSDEKVIEALKCDATVVHLTPYDVIGVVGGYLGELTLDRPKLRNQVPKSAS